MPMFIFDGISGFFKEVGILISLDYGLFEKGVSKGNLIGRARVAGISIHMVCYCHKDEAV